MTDPDRLLAIFATERLLEILPGQPPFKGCGISSFCTLAMKATDNEAGYAPNGLPMSRAQLTDLETKGWRAFTRVSDSNGIPDRDDAARIWRAMFPELEMPTSFVGGKRELRTLLDTGNAVSLAVRLRVLPARSQLRHYTSADHQITLWMEERGGRMRLVRPDPMHGHSTKYAGEIVDFDEVWTAADAIEDGAPALGWSHGISDLTAANRATQRLRGELRDERQAHDVTEVELRATKRRLAACEGGQPPPGDCADEALAAKVAAHRKSIAFHEAEIGE